MCPLICHAKFRQYIQNSFCLHFKLFGQLIDSHPLCVSSKNVCSGDHIFLTHPSVCDRFKTHGSFSSLTCSGIACGSSGTAALGCVSSKCCSAISAASGGSAAACDSSPGCDSAACSAISASA